MEPILILGILLAFSFNVLTGMNDAANSIATLVATRALSPARAIAMAAAANFLGPFLFTSAVAWTIAAGIVRNEYLSVPLLLAAMAAALSLVVLATLTGFPVSSSNALSGGLIGAALAGGGISRLILPDTHLLIPCLSFATAAGVLGGLAGGALSRSTRLPVLLGAISGALLCTSISITAAMLLGILRLHGIVAILLFIFVAPTLGLALAFTLDVIISHLFRRSRRTTRKRIFQPLHLFAAMLQGIGHGAHDGQHAMGIIMGLLLAGGTINSFRIPAWVLFGSALAISAGTCLGGWRVVERVARGITRIRPYQGFSAAASSALLLSVLTSSGIPVSSTHVMSGAIVGVGITRGRGAIQWETVRRIATAWLITVPAAILLSWTFMHAFQFAFR